MKALVFLLLIFTTCPFVFATENDLSIDRQPLVESAHRILPVLLSYYEQLPDSAKLDDDKLDVLKKVSTLARSGKVILEFIDEFDDPPGEEPRLMRSPENSKSPLEDPTSTIHVYVNRKVLNDPNNRINLTYVLKTLFHEIGHNIGVPSWGLRDHVAQRFEDLIAPFIQSKLFNNGLNEIIFFSIPAKKIDSALHQTSLYKPLPTYLILYRAQGTYRDLTPLLDEKFSKPASLMKAIFSELNRVIYALYGEMTKVMNGAMQTTLKMMSQFIPGTSDFMEGLKAIQVEEIRVLDLQSFDVATLEDSIFVSLKASYTLTRSSKERMAININGFPFNQVMTTPVGVHLLLPLSVAKIDKVEIGVEPQSSVDYSKVAKIKSVQRREGQPTTIKIELPSATEDLVQLSVNFGVGHLLLDAEQVVQNQAYFHIPDGYFVAGHSFIADSLLLDRNQTVYLDRLVILSEPQVGESHLVRTPTPDDTIVDNSVGFWGLKGGKKHFSNHFIFREPVIILSDVVEPRFSLNHSDLHLQFSLKRDIKIRQIRAHFKRMLTIINVEGKTPSKLMEAHVDGHLRRFATEGTLVEQKEVIDVAAVDSDEIYIAHPVNGFPKVRAHLQLPFRALRPLANPYEGYGPPVGNPIMVEVITDDLQVLRHYFGEEDQPCEDILNESFKGAFGNADVKTSFGFD